MKQSQFQTESSSVSNWFGARPSRAESANLESFQAGLESLFLGYRLRGWLADSEKELLDRLAHPNHLCFLMVEDEYLHPTGCKLFDDDTIRSSRMIEGQALFQHRFEPTDRQHGQCSVHSAQVSPYGARPVTIGLVGPDETASSIDFKSRFGRIVEFARQAWKMADMALGRLGDKSSASAPLLVVNRCSGRVLHASEAAVELLGQEASQLVDREFSSLKDILAPRLVGNRLTMTNLTIGNFMLASLEIGSAKAVEKPSAAFLTDRLVHKMRNKLSSITAASSYLVDCEDKCELEDATEMANIIRAEADKLDRLLNHLWLLTAYTNLPKVRSSLKDDLAVAQALLAKDKSGDIQIEIDHPVPPLTFEYPPSAISLLIESTTRCQAEHGSKLCRVITTREENSAKIEFHSDITGSPSPSDHIWQQYTDHLAELMNIVHRGPRISENRVTSSLEIVSSTGADQ